MLFFLYISEGEKKKKKWRLRIPSARFPRVITMIFSETEPPNLRTCMLRNSGALGRTVSHSCSTLHSRTEIARDWVAALLLQESKLAHPGLLNLSWWPTWSERIIWTQLTVSLIKSVGPRYTRRLVSGQNWEVQNSLDYLDSSSLRI